MTLERLCWGRKVLPVHVRILLAYFRVSSWDFAGGVVMGVLVKLDPAGPERGGVSPWVATGGGSCMLVLEPSCSWERAAF